MTSVLYLDKGRVRIPSDCRRRHSLPDGCPVLFFETKSGAMIIRPYNAQPELDLSEHLRQFNGVEIPDRSHHCPPRL